MNFLALVCFVHLFFQSIIAVAIPNQEDARDDLERRATTIIPVTGVSGATHTRLEISQMQAKNPNQWTLFLLGLKAYQAQSPSSMTSYYQISGIHGVPLQDWDGVSQCSSCTGAAGYCTHDSILFPAFHRAYVALFEQEFIKVVKNVANSYKNAEKKKEMQAAASVMRWPYWDWAAKPSPGQPVLPSSVTAFQVTVDGPNGQESFMNPLFRYDIEEGDMNAMYYSPFVKWNKTLRYPSSNEPDAISQTQSLITALNNIQPNMQDQVYQLFSTCADYLHFSNDDAGSSSTSCSNSIEGIHNNIHTSVGGPAANNISGGYMTYLPTAAFDPTFWLHHANVDRLFAMWQTLHPNAYSGSQVAPHNTWTIAQGTTQGLNSPLKPFYKNTKGQFWTTNDVRDWTAFHYTYPEFADSDGSKAAIASYVNKLYGPDATATAGSSKRTAAPESSNTQTTTATTATSESSTTSTPTSTPTTILDHPLKAQNGSLFQYVANIKTPRYALDGSYYIYLFDGQPTSDNPIAWITDPHLIGPMGVPAQDGMANKNLIATGSVPLTTTLSQLVVNGTLSDLSEATVVPYLKDNLHWTISGPGGGSVDPDALDGFQIAVYASTSTVPPVNELPVWSKFVPLAEITEHKAGGATNKTIPTN